MTEPRCSECLLSPQGWRCQRLGEGHCPWHDLGGGPLSLLASPGIWNLSGPQHRFSERIRSWKLWRWWRAMKSWWSPSTASAPATLSLSFLLLTTFTKSFSSPQSILWKHCSLERYRLFQNTYSWQWRVKLCASWHLYCSLKLPHILHIVATCSLSQVWMKIQRHKRGI